MNLKRDNWTNDEVINLLKSRRVDTSPSDEFKADWNNTVNQCIYLFYDMKADPKITAGAKALDTDTGNIVCIGRRLPQ